MATAAGAAAQFERFAAEMGEPAETMTMPPPAEVDVPKLLSIVPTYGIEMLLPPSPEARQLPSGQPTGTATFCAACGASCVGTCRFRVAPVRACVA